jgi:anthranilate/para-aminobenzoate synthase component II
MQLIGRAFDSKLKDFDRWIKGNIKIEIIKKDKVLGNKGLKKFFEYRGYGLTKVGKDLIILAKSEHGIEAIKHKKFPIWGTQFHPEVVFENENSGREIIKNFIKVK